MLDGRFILLYCANLVVIDLFASIQCLKKVDSGSYGHVWKVEDKATKQMLALKEDLR